MYLCDDDHDEVCYNSGRCPVCEKQKLISDLEDEVFNLKEERDELKDQIKELEKEGEA
jgi:cell division protein FtsB